MSRSFFFLLSALFSVSLAQDFSPFQLLGSNGPLNGTEFANDNFSPSDKIVVCEGNMVFVDLDAQISFFEEGPQLTLERCANAFAPASKLVQVWNYVPSTTYAGLGYIVLSNPPNYYWNNTCLNIPVGSAMQANATVNTFECLPGKEQFWQFNQANGNIVMMGNGSSFDNGGNMCLTVGYPGDQSIGLAGSALTTAPCDPATPFTQVFAWSPSGGSIVLASTAGNPSPVCVDAGHLGQIISYNPTSSAWSISPTHSEVCRDPQGEEISNPPFLPRTSLRDYTVGVKRMASDILGFDRLIILDGDNADNNVWYSDDCGVNWNCYPGTNPWSTSGLALATVMQVPKNGNWEFNSISGGVLNFGGVNYNPTDNDPYTKTAMYYSGNGFQYSTLQTTLPNLPANNESVVWPGMVASDGQNLYFFGDDTFDGWPNAVWKLDSNTFSYGGPWTKLSNGETSLSAVPKARYFYMAGSTSGGCWFSNDYHAGATWGNPDGETWSTNLWYTSMDLMSWRMGPVNAPWAPRAASGWTQSGDLTKAYLVGGMEFVAGVPDGNTFSDAWSMDASVCLYGDNGQVCSGNGNPDLTQIVCNCINYPAGLPYLGQYCDQCPPSFAGPQCTACAPCVNGFCNGDGTITGDASCVCNAGWSGPACDQSNTTQSSTSTPSVSATPSNSPVGPGTSPSNTPSRTPSRTRSRTASRSSSPIPAGGGGASASSSGVSPGAAAGISVTVILLALGGGAYVFVTYFGGAAFFSGYTSVVKGSGGGGGGGGAFAASSGAATETKALFKVGSKVGTTISSSQAASRFAASGGGSAVPASTSFQGGTQLKGSYTSF